jgi:hypothetical protein
MKHGKWIAIVLALGLLYAPDVFAWQQQGHAAIAALAEQLVSPNAKERIAKLLGQGGDKDLVSIASWADEVILANLNEGPLRGNQEALEFNRKFPKSGMWHFINLPLGATSYEQVRGFTSSEDVVHAIDHCIQVLETPAQDLQPQEFTQVEALRLLVHFVGDIHQPLHCGTGFYSFPESQTVQLITGPEEATGKPNDRGGNLLYYGPNPTDQLHAFWDRVLVAEADGTIDYRALADFLQKNYLSKEIPPPPGDYHKWAENWAIQSVEVALLAYQGITFGNPEFDSGGRLTRINIVLPRNYIEVNKLRAGAQLARAGLHLAQLLDRINWQ